MRYKCGIERVWRSVMRKAWLVSAVMAAGLAALWAGSTSASAGVASLLPSATDLAQPSDGITKVTYRRYYYEPDYYSGYYYASPYVYAYPPRYYYPPAVVYAVPPPR